eukprot:5753614-Amphidinium_carterae.1
MATKTSLVNIHDSIDAATPADLTEVAQLRNQCDGRHRTTSISGPSPFSMRFVNVSASTRSTLLPSSTHPEQQDLWESPGPPDV